MESGLEFQKTLTQWVEKVLEKHNFEKIHVEFPDYDSSGGSAGEMTFVDVHTEKCGNLKKFQMIIKKNKVGDVALEALDLKLAYETEVNVYATLVPFFENFAKGKNTKIFDDMPRCYGTIKENDRYVLILENLKAKGYKLHELKQTMDLNHVKLVLTAYGKWHAFSFAIRDQGKGEIFKDFEGGSRKFLNSKIFKYFKSTIQNEIDFIIDMYKERNNEKMIPKLEMLKENYSRLFTEIVAPENGEFLVVRHGDCWNNNFLFHYEDDGKTPDKVAIIDWQLGFLGVPTADVAQFLFHSCSRKELEHLDELLAFYYGELSQKLSELGSHLAKCFPWNICVETFRKYIPIGISGCPMNAKMSNSLESDENFELEDILKDGNFSKFLGKLGNTEGYFDRVNGVLELCIDRNLI